MALRDQPYLPLYVQDFLTDEKLIECSAAATGVYIRIMCIMHKSDPYGVILLKQKDKQTTEQIQNFALKLLRSMPYQLIEISSALQELISEGVLQISGDELQQKRMIRDFDISEKRSKAGKIGGDKNKFAQANIEANIQANTENENEIESDIIIDKEILLKKRETEFRQLVFECDPIKYSQDMLENFCRYWTEPNRSQTKMRYELEKVFDIPRRLITWSNRDKEIKSNHGSNQQINRDDVKHVNRQW